MKFYSRIIVLVTFLIVYAILVDAKGSKSIKPPKSQCDRLGGTCKLANTCPGKSNKIVSKACGTKNANIKCCIPKTKATPKPTNKPTTKSPKNATVTPKIASTQGAAVSSKASTLGSQTTANGPTSKSSREATKSSEASTIGQQTAATVATAKTTI